MRVKGHRQPRAFSVAHRGDGGRMIVSGLHVANVATVKKLDALRSGAIVPVSDAQLAVFVRATCVHLEVGCKEEGVRRTTVDDRDWARLELLHGLESYRALGSASWSPEAATRALPPPLPPPGWLVRRAAGRAARRGGMSIR